METEHKYFDVEKQILGKLLLDNSNFDKISERLEISHFQDRFHRALFAMMVVFVDLKLPFDVVTVLDELKASAKRFGGIEYYPSLQEYLFDIVRNTVTGNNIGADVDKLITEKQSDIDLESVWRN